MLLTRRLGAALTVLVTAGATLSASAVAADAAAVPSGKLRVPATVGRNQADRAASFRWASVLFRTGAASGAIAGADRITAFTVRARGDRCDGAPRMVLRVDRRAVRTWTVTTIRYGNYRVSGSWPAGAHNISVAFLNDRYVRGRCDRNLHVDRVTATLAGNPFAGRRGYLDPNSSAAVAARTASPTDAALLRKIADHPHADWVGDWNPVATVAAEVRGWMLTQSAAGAMPVLVLYAIPGRDCGGYAGGGYPDAPTYAAWVDQVARGIGATRVAVILEPDALPGEDCLSAAARTARERMLAAAVTRLNRQPGVAVYLDAGHEVWQPVSVMATRLRAANVAQARGFSINVSNFYPTASEERYGDQLVAALGGGKHFVVDTSRNGRGSNGQWCNPDGRGLGVPWTTATGDPRADALLWIKPPGETDGPCNGGPADGFWLAYALGLAARAVF